MFIMAHLVWEIPRMSLLQGVGGLGMSHCPHGGSAGASLRILLSAPIHDLTIILNLSLECRNYDILNYVYAAVAVWWGNQGFHEVPADV